MQEKQRKDKFVILKKANGSCPKNSSCMAITKKDLFEFGKKLKTELLGAMAQQRTDIVRDIRDEMDAQFSAFRNEMQNNMQTLEARINSNVISLMTDSVMPAIDRVHDRVDAGEKQLHRIDTRLDKIDVRLDGIDTRLDNMDTRFDSVDARFNESDKRSDGLIQKIDHLETNLTKEIRLVRNFVGMA